MTLFRGPDREFDTEDDLHNHMPSWTSMGIFEKAWRTLGSDDFGLGGDFGAGETE